MKEEQYYMENGEFIVKLVRLSRLFSSLKRGPDLVWIDSLTMGGGVDAINFF